MLVLYETPAGYALFKTKKSQKDLTDPDVLQRCFATDRDARKNARLMAFHRFENTARALKAASNLAEGRMESDLKRFLREHVAEGEVLAVADAKLGGSIAKKLSNITVVADSAIQELFREIRSQLALLLGASGDTDGEEIVVSEQDLQAMALGLSHSLGRFKIRFSTEKVDTMVVQAVALLDDLDKELNTYCMRLKEWYGWHFPELARIVVDSVAYARIIKLVGFRTNVASTDFSDILPDNLEADVKAAAEVSMGTEISDGDLIHIESLADQVISISSYRGELFEYLRNRMSAIAPNLTAMVGELVGARLIARAGSLISLAKCPASTLQILGAEKALFRALKTKHDTPKYGLIYHAGIVGQAAPKLKGKISRVLAAKTSLAVRVDVLTERTADDDQDADDSSSGVQDDSMGVAARQKVEERLRQLESAGSSSFSKGGAKARPNHQSSFAARRPAQSSSFNQQSFSTKGDFTSNAKRPRF